MTESLRDSARAFRRAERGIWWAAFVVIMACGAVWLLAVPTGAGPDEASQLYRASAVARGELAGAKPATLPPFVVSVKVPAATAVAGARGLCFYSPFVKGAPVSSGAGFPFVPPRCDDPPKQATGTQTVTTNQYRTQPTYYVMVGWMERLLPVKPAIYAMRFLSLVVVAAFLASALASTLRAPWPRLAAVGVFACITPTAAYLLAMLNTGGLEIAAAVSLWVSGLVLVGGTRAPDARLLARCGAALVALAVVRGFSPLFAVGIVLSVLVAVPGSSQRLIGLWRAAQLRRHVVGWAVATFFGFGLSAAWLLFIMKRFPLPTPPGHGIAAVPSRFFPYLRQAVGMFGDSSSALSPWLVVVWIVAVAAIVVVGMSGGGRRARLASMLALAAALALDVGADAFSFPPTGYYWQGRYVLPWLVGVVLVAATTASPDGAIAGRRLTDLAKFVVPSALVALWLAQVAAVVAVARQVGAQSGSIEHYGVALTAKAALTNPNWRPPFMPMLGYLVWYMIAMAAFAGGCWVHMQRVVDDPSESSGERHEGDCVG